MTDKSDKKNADGDFEKQLQELETKLIEQDRRPIHVLTNYLTRRDMYPNPKDPRRFAATKAIVFRILFSPAAIGSGVALSSLAVLIWHGCLLHTNNAELRSSNSLILDGNRLYAQEL